MYLNTLSLILPIFASLSNQSRRLIQIVLAAAGWLIEAPLKTHTVNINDGTWSKNNTLVVNWYSYAFQHDIEDCQKYEHIQIRMGPSSTYEGWLRGKVKTTILSAA